MSKSLFDKIVDNRKLAKGVKTHLKEFAANGITPERVQMFMERIDNIEKMKGMMNELRAKLNKQAQFLNFEMSEMAIVEDEFKAIVKMILPKSEWSKFAIYDN